MRVAATLDLRENDAGMTAAPPPSCLKSAYVLCEVMFASPSTARTPIAKNSCGMGSDRADNGSSAVEQRARQLRR